MNMIVLLCFPGYIGVTRTGIPIRNPFTKNPNKINHNHPQKSTHHYCNETRHGYTFEQVIRCLSTQDIEPTILAVASDGYPIYGHLDSHRRTIFTMDLDLCHGRFESSGKNGVTVTGSYRYYLTLDFPYITSCFRGRIEDNIKDIASSSAEIAKVLQNKCETVCLLHNRVSDNWVSGCDRPAYIEKKVISAVVVDNVEIKLNGEEPNDNHAAGGYIIFTDGPAPRETNANTQDPNTILEKELTTLKTVNKNILLNKFATIYNEKIRSTISATDIGNDISSTQKPETNTDEEMKHKTMSDSMQKERGVEEMTESATYHPQNTVLHGLSSSTPIHSETLEEKVNNGTYHDKYPTISVISNTETESQGLSVVTDGENGINVTDNLIAADTNDINTSLSPKHIVTRTPTTFDNNISVHSIHPLMQTSSPSSSSFRVNLSTTSAKLKDIPSTSSSVVISDLETTESPAIVNNRSSTVNHDSNNKMSSVTEVYEHATNTSGLLKSEQGGITTNVMPTTEIESTTSVIGTIVNAHNRELISETVAKSNKAVGSSSASSYFRTSTKSVAQSYNSTPIDTTAIGKQAIHDVNYVKKNRVKVTTNEHALNNMSPTTSGLIDNIKKQLKVTTDNKIPLKTTTLKKTAVKSTTTTPFVDKPYFLGLVSDQEVSRIVSNIQYIHENSTGASNSTSANDTVTAAVASKQSGKQKSGVPNASQLEKSLGMSLKMFSYILGVVLCVVGLCVGFVVSLLSEDT